jgi:predicted nucleic acid-binding protein
MGVLIDTSIMVRLANTSDVSHANAMNAVFDLHRQGEVLHITAQNLVEFRSVATRPMSANGLGLNSNAAELKAAEFEQNFALLPESPEIYPAWKALVKSVSVLGKQVHDARLVAVCHVHDISHILTFNVGHFSRLVTFGPAIIILEPAKNPPSA